MKCYQHLNHSVMEENGVSTRTSDGMRWKALVVTRVSSIVQSKRLLNIACRFLKRGNRRSGTDDRMVRESDE